MGFLDQLADPLDFSGVGGANAAADAADQQLQSTRLATEEQRLAREQARGDLAPFRDEGVAGLGGLSDLITNQGAQKDFISRDPFFRAQADAAQRRILNSQAAKGKAGSGETAKALQNSLLILGNDVLGQNIDQRFNAATLGANAASGQATATLETGNTIADLATQGGNAAAAGIIGAQNAAIEGRENLAGTATGLARVYDRSRGGDGSGVFASDRRIKTDINEVGKLDNGLPVYTFRYIGEDKMQMSVMAQDVQEVMPDAVVDIGGVLHVKMDMIGGRI